MDGVIFLGETRDRNLRDHRGGTSCFFTATAIPASPSGQYTATVTDSLGNTSELMFRVHGKPPAGPEASFPATIDFG